MNASDKNILSHSVPFGKCNGTADRGPNICIGGFALLRYGVTFLSRGGDRDFRRKRMIINRLLGLFSNDLAIDLGTATTLVYVKG